MIKHFIYEYISKWILVIELFYIIIFAKLVLQYKAYNNKDIFFGSNNISILFYIALYLIIIKADWSNATIISSEVRIVKRC